MIKKLEITNLTVGYNNSNILESLSLSLYNNEILAVVGQSGAGKTTLLKTIAGFIKPINGQIKIEDKTLNSRKVFLESNKRGVGLIFQDFALFPHLNVFENVAFGLKKQDKELVFKYLELCKLKEKAKYYPEELSGGQKQRVAIARSIILKPKLLLLDEPFSNIDYQTRFYLIKKIKDILKKAQIPAIFITHNLEETFYFATKIAILGKNRNIEQIDLIKNVFAKPKSKFVADFLKAGQVIKINSYLKNTLSLELGDMTIENQKINKAKYIFIKDEDLLFNCTSGFRYKIIDKTQLKNTTKYSLKIKNTILDIQTRVNLQKKKYLFLDLDKIIFLKK